MIAANQNLQVVSLQNQYVPANGKVLAVPVYLDFTDSGTIALDLSVMITRGFIDMVQTIYIDASNLAQALVIQVDGSNQSLPIKPATAGYYTILMPNPAKCTFVSTVGGGRIGLFFMNVPIPGAVWPTA